MNEDEILITCMDTKFYAPLVVWSQCSSKKFTGKEGESQRYVHGCILHSDDYTYM